MRSENSVDSSLPSEIVVRLQRLEIFVVVTGRTLGYYEAAVSRNDQRSGRIRNE
jgi:hypothetical protein